MRNVEVDLALDRRDLRRVRPVGRDRICGSLGVEEWLAVVGQALRSDALRLGRRKIRAGLEGRLLSRLDRIGVVAVVQSHLLMRGQAAVPGAGKRLVRAAL